MAYEFPNITINVDKTYGPTCRDHYYFPAPYHNPSAKKRAHKNRWCLKPPHQYEVFRIAELHFNQYSCDGGLYGFLNNADEILGKDNEERFAFFPNSIGVWHGYPIRSIEISEEIVKGWYEDNLISLRTYRDILKRNI